jgi:hypothetical protein
MRPGWPPPESLPARGTALPNGNALAELAVFLQGAVREALLVAHLDARQVEHAVLHGAGDALALADMVRWIEGR